MREKRRQEVGALENPGHSVFCTISRVQTASDGDTADLLAPLPTVQGAFAGYSRVPARGQLPSLDRPGRSIQDLVAIVSGPRVRGIGFTWPHEALGTTTPGGRLHARDPRARPEIALTSIARLIGVHRDTIHTYTPGPKRGRATLGETASTPPRPRSAQSAD